MIDELDDILSDDELFSDIDLDDKLYNTDRYKRTVTNISKSSSRKNMGSNFSRFEKIFSNIREEIAYGNKKIISIEETTISKEKPIKQGNFYVDNGIMLYVNKIYNPETNEEFSEATNRRYKVHTVYENGTENNIYLLSLVSSLYDKKRNGRVIVDNNIDESNTTITTGFIYVVKYAGDDERFSKLDNLHKIGFAKDIKRRLSNTENESTYLYSKVKEVARFEVVNVNARVLEKAIHHRLEENRVSLETSSVTGKIYAINEWFIVPLEEIHKIINEIISELSIR